MICPDCSGQKQIYAHVNYGSYGEFKWINCTRCKGSGAVPDEQAQWIEDGKKLRAARLATETTLRDEAKRMGISASELSAMERGIRPAIFRQLIESKR